MLVVIASAALCLLLFAPQSASAQADEAAVQQVIAMINGWRIGQGTWPLRENATLSRIALDQATYVLSLPSLPREGDIHLDAQGRGPAVRARLPRYDWPAYGADIYTAVGEIAYVGFNLDAARRFWEQSTIHRNTLLNTAYREIGVAVLPHRLGHLYMVEFGARPDVLPAIADLQTNTLYLSNERYSRARSPWMRNAQQVRLFDADGRPLETDWIPWQMTIALPSGVGDQVYVEYSDGGSGLVLAPVSLAGQTSALPTGLPSATPTRTPSLASTATRAAGTSTPAVSATATAVPARGTATAAPTLAPTSATAAGSITLLYDSHSFTLLNTGRTPANVAELVFAGQGQTQTFAVSRWATQWLSGSLAALPAGDCLGAWSWTEPSTLDKPASCRQRRSVLTLAPDQLFWKRGDFEVRLRNTVLATCHASDLALRIQPALKQQAHADHDQQEQDGFAKRRLVDAAAQPKADERTEYRHGQRNQKVLEHQRRHVPGGDVRPDHQHAVDQEQRLQICLELLRNPSQDSSRNDDRRSAGVVRAAQHPGGETAAVCPCRVVDFGQTRAQQAVERITDQQDAERRQDHPLVEPFQQQHADGRADDDADQHAPEWTDVQGVAIAPHDD
ncbi:MAG: CAP domain-containing protein [Anaerolineae bacterium]